MQTSGENGSFGSTIIVILMIALLLAVSVLFYMVLQIRRMYVSLEMRQRRLTRGEDGDNLENTIVRMFDENDSLHQRIESLEKELDDIQEQLRMSIQKTGIIKYDAFHQMGGSLSSSIVLLNGNNDGFIINNIQGVDGCYSYVKEINAGVPESALSKEENIALEDALMRRNKQ